MGKRLEDLDLGDSGPPARDDLARSQRDADMVVLTLREMEDDAHYEFAYGMLVDMRVTIEQSGRVSDAQRQAIQNIQDGAERHAAGQRRRRYDGFNARYR